MIISNLACRLPSRCSSPAPRAQGRDKYIKFATSGRPGRLDVDERHDTTCRRISRRPPAAELKFKILSRRGVPGEEKDVVKKIRIGQLQAGGFTGVGLGEIAPETRLLDAPWLFHNRRELVHVREKFSKDFAAAVEKGGFVVLGWTDLGSVYVFSKNPIAGPDDMKKAKMWVWEGTRSRRRHTGPSASIPDSAFDRRRDAAPCRPG